MMRAQLVDDDPRRNRVLASLAERELADLLPDLEAVRLPLGKVLYEPNGKQHYAVFPTRGIVSLQCVVESGHTLEAAQIGNEGLTGSMLFMGGEFAPPIRAIVRSAGAGYQLRSCVATRNLFRGNTLQPFVLREFQAVMTQMIQIAVCNRIHSLEQQLCRLLLTSLDRLPSNSLKMTQELIASLLATRRESISEAAGRLRRLGLIRYRRGHITVIDRAALEAHCCECYGIIRRAYVSTQASTEASTRLSTGATTSTPLRCTGSGRPVYLPGGGGLIARPPRRPAPSLPGSH